MSKIVSVTIAHNRESTIAGALACVEPHVDECLVLDTGITDRTLEVARETVGPKLRLLVAPWRDDFSWARNRALDFAAERGAAWAILIDTDQRIAWNGLDPRKFLSGDGEFSVFTLRSRDGRFVKEQIFAMPRARHYIGRTHECYPLFGDVLEVPLARVWEVKKTAAELQAKHARDLRLLQLDIDDCPANARAWYYLAEAHLGLEQKDEALRAFKQAYVRSASPQESAWSAYRAAKVEDSRDRLQEALAWCLRGLGRCGNMAENSAYAAWVTQRQGKWEPSLVHARVALRIGHEYRSRPTGFFRDVDAYYETPAGLAALASGALGRVEEAKLYEQERLRLRALRLAETA